MISFHTIKVGAATALVLLHACGGITNSGESTFGDDGGGAGAVASDAGFVSNDGGAATRDGRAPDGASPDASDASGSGGGGWFFPYERVDTPSLFSAGAVALGDVTGDGAIDAVVSGMLQTDPNFAVVQALFVFAGDGHGHFAPAVTTTIGPYAAPPQTLVVGDVTGDGRSDAVFGQGNSLVVYPQLANGTFGAPTAYDRGSMNYVIAVVLGDVDLDGIPEVLVLGSDSVAVYRRDGHGGLVVASVSPFASGRGFALGAVTAATLPAVVGTRGLGNGSQIGVAPAADGGFGAAKTYDIDFSESASRLDIGDVDGDGMSDVVVSVGGNRPSSKLAIFTQANGALRAVRKLPSADIPAAVRVVDVDGDGRKDVVVLHSTWMSVGVYIQRATGALADEQLVDFQYIDGADMATGDIDGDGKVDLVAATGGGLAFLRHLP